MIRRSAAKERPAPGRHRRLARHVSALAVLALVLAIAATLRADEQPLTVLTEELPPFNFVENGTLRGIATDVLTLMFEDCGLQNRCENVQVMPWPRAMATARTQPDALLYSVTRTPDREDWFKWVGPIISNRISLMARRDRHVRMKTLAEADALKMGAVPEFAATQLLLHQGYPARSLDYSPDMRSNVLKLQAGRIDLFACNELAFAWMLPQLGLRLEDFEPVYVLRDGEMFYACNKEVPDDTVSRLQRSLDKLKKSGRIQAIVDGYLK